MASLKFFTQDGRVLQFADRASRDAFADKYYTKLFNLLFKES